MTEEKHDPLGAMFARMDADPYAPLLSAALLVQSEIDFPAREMALWTGPYRNDGRKKFDQATARMERERDDLLEQHPATPVVRAIKNGLRKRTMRLEAEKAHEEGIKAIVSGGGDTPYLAQLVNIRLSLDYYIEAMDRMGVKSLSPSRRKLSQASDELRDLIADCAPYVGQPADQEAA